MERFNRVCAQVAESLSKCQVIPVVVVEGVAAGERLCATLADAGLPCAEITFRTSDAAAIIRQVAASRPDILLGAGTVLTPGDLHKAQEAGAAFAVAPGCNPAVAAEAVSMGFPFFPGVATPSDIERALETGCRMMKFFPAEAIGGTRLLKALAAPYRHLGVRFIPTGGLTMDNMGDYLAIPEVAAVGGTWLAKPEDIRAGRWDAIAEAARATVERLAGSAAASGAAR